MWILLIEDDAATARSIELMLRSEGHNCDIKRLGEDGLAAAKLYDYGVILLDLMLPDMDGLEVLRRLRADTGPKNPAFGGCASSLSYLARFIMRGSSVGRFGEVASDLVARRGAAKALSLAFEE